jgi:hypothetical protein
MFKLQSNRVCNNILFNLHKIDGMHPSMVKLYKVAKDARDIVGQSAVARALVESPQTVKNWESRGISKGGAMKAQAVFGCNANDLLQTKADISVPAVQEVNEPVRPYLQPRQDKWIAAAIDIMRELDEPQKQAMVARMREFRQYLGPPRDGQALSVAG